MKRCIDYGECNVKFRERIGRMREEVKFFGYDWWFFKIEGRFWVLCWGSIWILSKINIEKMIFRNFKINLLEVGNKEKIFLKISVGGK